MADTKISALTDAASVNSTDELPIVQSATTKRATVAEVAAAIQALTDLDELADVVITSVADGHVLTWDSGTSKWVNEAPSGGAGAIRVEDEGGTIVAAATGINFAGAGVTVTDAGSNEALVTIPGGGGGGGTAELLARVAHRPASETNFTTTSTAFVDVDATNLAATFTAPASGAVLVRLTGIAQINSNTVLYYWGLRSGSSDVTGSSMFVMYGAGSYRYTSAACLITGLTSGTSYTYKWAHRVSASATGQLRTGGNNGAAVMEVWAA